MTGAHPAHSTAGRDDGGIIAAIGLAEWLCLAATPTFAIVALLTSLGGSAMDGVCSSGHGAPLSGIGHHVPAHERVSFAAVAEVDPRAGRLPEPSEVRASPAVEDAERLGGQDISTPNHVQQGRER